MEQYRTQLSALCHKNFLLMTRDRKRLLMIVFAPVLMALAILYFQSLLGDAKKATKVSDPAFQAIEKVPRCSGPKHCVSLGYFVVGEPEPWIDETMSTLARNNDLNFGSDVKMLLQGDPADVLRYTDSHKNETQIAIVFCTKTWSVGFGKNSIQIPCHFEKLEDKKMVFYSIYYNMTLGFQTPYFVKLSAPYPTNKLVVSVKRAIDEALVEVLTKQPFTLDLRMQSFPTTENKFLKSYDFMSAFGSFFCYLPTAVS